MKRLLISALIGGLLTGLLFAVSQVPTSGPTPLPIFVVVPFQVLASLITKDRTLGEFGFYGIQFLVFSGVGYLVMCMLRGFRPNEGRK